MNGPELFAVEDVLERYRLRDRRAARRIMDEAGAFAVAGKLFVRFDDLLAFERDMKRAREPSVAEPTVRRHRRARQAVARVEPLAPGWWRADGGERS